MRRMNLVILTAVAFSAPAIARQDKVDAPDIPARIYVNRCTGCHTIGRGALTGPDLQPATRWPAPDLRIAVEKMQEKSGPMTPDEIDGLVEFLKGDGIEARLAAEEARIALQYAAKLDPPSPATGARLFAGRDRLENGGLSCVSCHRVGAKEGGLLGPDLFGIFQKTGETGLRSACEKTQFKIMAAAYRDHPVTKQEAMHLTAFFEQVEAESSPQSSFPAGSSESAPPFVVAGASLAAVLFLLTLFALRNRHRSVRQSLVQQSLVRQAMARRSS